MKTMLNSILNLLLLLCLVACSSGTNIAPLLSEAEEYMNEKPDSALFLLESITYPKDLTQEQNALWCLLITQARDKEFVKHTSDSLINIAVDYFNKTDDVDRKAQSYYCQGRVLTDMLLFDRAIVSYLKAEELVQQTTNYNLQARICNQLGDLYDKNMFYEDALSYYWKAYDSYKLTNNLLGVAYALRDIGSSYEYTNQLDSASYYLKKSLEIAEENKWHNLSTSLYAYLGNICESQQLYPEAVDYLYKSMNEVREDSQSYSLYYSLGFLYKEMGQVDSGLYYLNKATDSPDLYIQCQLNHVFSDLSFEKKDYETAYHYNEQYILLRDSIEHLYQPQKLAEAEARYNYEILINEKNQLIIKKKDTMLYFSFGIIILLIIIFIMYVCYRKVLHRKELEIDAKKQALIKCQSEIEINKVLLIEKENDLRLKVNELEENIKAVQSLTIEKQKLEEVLAQRSRSLSDEIANLQNDIKQKDSLYENKQHELSLKKKELEENEEKIKLVEDEKHSLESLFSEETYTLNKRIADLQNAIAGKESVIKELKKRSKQVVRKYLEDNCPQMKKLYDKNEIVTQYTDKEWSVFEEQFCSVYPRFITKLCKNFPKMKKKELRICCLILLGIKTSKISTVMKLEKNTISKYPKEVLKKYVVQHGVESLEELLDSMI